MSGESVSIRPLRQGDFKALHGRNAPSSCRGLAFEKDGALVALGGVKLEGGYYIAFIDIRPGVPLARTAVWRGALEGMKRVLGRMRAPVYAVSDKDIPGSEAFARRLGFTKVHDTDMGAVMVWNP